MKHYWQAKINFDVDVLIPENDPFYTLNEILDSLDYSCLYATYNRRWRRFYPHELFKIIVFAYMKGKYSARDIEEACKTDIRFMAILNGAPAPDHATIARFQNGNLVSVIENLFFQLVNKLAELNEIHLTNLFVDGTKIEAYANRYSFVWKKALSKNFVKLQDKMSATLSEIIFRYGLKQDIDCITACNLLRQQAILQQVKFVYGSGKRKTQLQRDVEKIEEFLSKHKEYSTYLSKLGTRNSLSKTDLDATFMRMKEDHMRNGQLKPGYNIQIGVDSEYIVGVGSFPDRSDVNTLIPFLERIKKGTGKTYPNIIADAGYESEENYKYLTANNQTSYIKPANYERSKTRNYRNNISLCENMSYDQERNEFICHAGKRLRYIYTTHEKTKSGFIVNKSNYLCESCAECSYRNECFKGKREDRLICVSMDMMQLRKASRTNITSEYGIQLRMNRSIQVEGAFGVLKEDYGFRRFLTRGKNKTETQFMLLAMAFNIQKLHNKGSQGRQNTELFSLKDA